MANDMPVTTKIGQYLVNMLLSAPMWLVKLLPYRLRVRAMGWTMSRLVAPALGYRNRIRQNLDLVWPDLPEAEKDALTKSVPNNFGRTLIEVYSGARFKRHVLGTPIEGPGVDALEQARTAGRPVVLVSGHFGNHDVFRATLTEKYGPVGGLYRPLNNVYFNAHWEAALTGITEPIFARGRKGLAEMVKYLRKGNIIMLLVDQHLADGADLTFFGKPAKTTVSAAQMALKYDALFLPIFGVRNDDGMTFRVHVDAPIDASDELTMAQDFNDRLEAMVRQHPDQWFWIHRRWKGIAGG